MTEATRPDDGLPEPAEGLLEAVLEGARAVSVTATFGPAEGDVLPQQIEAIEVRYTGEVPGVEQVVDVVQALAWLPYQPVRGGLDTLRRAVREEQRLRLVDAAAQGKSDLRPE